MEDLPSGEAVVFYMAPVHVLSCGTTVYKGWTGFDFYGVCGPDSHLNNQVFRAWSGCNYIPLWEASLPSMKFEEPMQLDRFVCDFIWWLCWWWGRKGVFILNLQALKSVMYRQQGHIIHIHQLQSPKSSFCISASTSTLELSSGISNMSARARGSRMSSSFSCVIIIQTSNAFGHSLA